MNLSKNFCEFPHRGLQISVYSVYVSSCSRGSRSRGSRSRDCWQTRRSPRTSHESAIRLKTNGHAVKSILHYWRIRAYIKEGPESDAKVTQRALALRVQSGTEAGFAYLSGHLMASLVQCFDVKSRNNNNSNSNIKINNSNNWKVQHQQEQQDIPWSRFCSSEMGIFQNGDYYFNLLKNWS